MSHSENDEANENECDKVPLLTINNDADSDTIPEILVASNKTSETDIHTNLLSKRLSGPNHQQKTYRKNRRIDHSRRSRSDKWGRIRLGVLSLGFLFIIYFGFLFGTEDSIRSPTILVNVPPQDESLPGPKVTDDFELTNDGRSFRPISNKFYSTLSSDLRTSISTIASTTVAINETVPDGYLVWSPKCQMPALNPLADDVMKLFHREAYEACSKTQPLTSIQMNWETSEATLVVDTKMLAKKMSCCYQEIQRSGSGKHADAEFKLWHCIDFNVTTVLPATIEYIIVRCKSKKETYVNSHAIIRERPDIRQRLNAMKQSEIIDSNATTDEAMASKRPLSVLMLSIDSISRLNLIRAMPKTAQHLYDNPWFELQGYNKIDDNTYPNVMAIMTGYNNTLAYNKCAPTVVGKLDTCPFMWKSFRDAGYVTANAEDEASISTFNYQKVGFQQVPTDYYLRPYMLAAEKVLPIKKKHSLTFCLGYKHSTDHVYDYALDFATQYRNESFFGLFWTNTFSHNDISDPSSMDQKMKNYMVQLEERGILNDSMVVFFSDHGLRFGPVRHLITGWLEERLPFIFISLPPWFRDEHPEIVEALKINRNRLTNPYDLHMTLKHILELSGRVSTQPPATSCANCQSLFKVMPWSRSCEETSIASHWCTCAAYKDISKNDSIGLQAVHFVIDYMNDELKKNKDGKFCAKILLDKISFVRMADNAEQKYSDYMVMFRAKQSNGWFESTVRYFFESGNFEMTGSVSRLDMYGSQSKCMRNDHLKKYCYCNRKLLRQ